MAALGVDAPTREREDAAVGDVPRDAVLHLGLPQMFLWTRFCDSSRVGASSSVWTDHDSSWVESRNLAHHLHTPMSTKPLAYEAYQELADSYAANVDTKAHNAYYERPAMLSLLPEVEGQRVLDAGCGPGVYAEELLSRGATVVSCDMSERMLELAARRLEEPLAEGRVTLELLDLTQPLPFEAESFALVLAPLCLDYIEDWRALFAEFHRVLEPGGTFLFSCGHPAFDAEYFETKRYFSIEKVTSVWRGFGSSVVMPTFRRSLEEILSPSIEAGFILESVHEPRPTQDFKRVDRRHYDELMRRPGFLCVRGRKPR